MKQLSSFFLVLDGMPIQSAKILLLAFSHESIVQATTTCLRLCKVDDIPGIHARSHSQQRQGVVPTVSFELEACGRNIAVERHGKCMGQG